MFIFIVSLIYFAPTLNAVIRFGEPRKRNWSAIFILNLLLGWTLIGWVIALVWSETKDARLTS
ncbi:MAG: superinfection immunity protein [Thermoplasmataceae archaeon]